MTTPLRSFFGAALCALLLSSAVGIFSGATAHEPATGVETDSDGQLSASALPRLWKTLGNRSFPITTADPLAQSYFDQGLRLAYAFNHAEALVSFRAAQQVDPACALCFWGEALVLGPNINAPMPAEAAAVAWRALEQATALAPRTGPKEQALIAALTERYSPDPTVARGPLDQAYATAMSVLAASFPQDDDIAVLAAEAMMTASPWDYWEADGATPKGWTAETLTLLETVLDRNPDHAAAIHLYIHTVEASTRPERAEVYADRLADLMPGAGHLVHMPAHIFARVGRYRDSILTNQAAVVADEAYFAAARAAGIEVAGLYPGGYYPHNIHFILTSAQMAGADRAALGAADKLAEVIDPAVARELAWVQLIMAAPAFAHAQFSDDATILALPAPAEDFPFVKALWHYARSLAWSRQGETGKANDEIDALANIGGTHDFQDLEAGGVPANDILQLAYHVMLARVFQSQGLTEEAAEQFRAAMVVQDQLPYMEPAFWYYPVAQSLGAVLLQGGKPEEAAALFRELVEEDPGNAWAHYGLLEAQRALGDNEGAEATRRRLGHSWLGATEHRTLDRL